MIQPVTKAQRVCEQRNHDIGLISQRSIACVLSMLIAGCLVAGLEASDAEVAARAYRQQLTALAERCEELGLVQQAVATREWWITRDPNRHYFFLPTPQDPTHPDADASDVVQFWYERFTEYRQRRAETLFEVARQLSNSGQEARAYRLLHEVLREDPQHVLARQILGYVQTNRGWQVAQRGPMVVPPQRFRWQGGRHWTIDHGHFRITTDVDRRSAEQVAEFLEDVYAVWRQLFFDYWSIPGRLTDRFAGREVSLAPARKFQIVLFKDREQYVNQLRRFEPRIAMSAGYYSRDAKAAFFVADGQQGRTTWAHEVTHQFFQETGNAVPLAGETSNFWVVEGVALYIESLVRGAGYCTTGGVDTNRLQYARYRTLAEGFQVPLDQLVTYGRSQVQRHEKIRRLYSYVAGLTQFLLHHQNGDLRRPFVAYVQAVYRGQVDHRTLSDQLGTEYAQLDESYLRFLDVSDEDLAFVQQDCRALCLGHTAVTDEGLSQLGDCDQLRWLDLSFTRATDHGLAHCARATQLQQLNLEKTAITDQAMETIAGFRQLEELDLSRTSITDAALDRIADLKELKILWLTRTNISDRGLQKLASLRKLEQLDLQGTRVTAAAVEQLRQALPRW